MLTGAQTACKGDHPRAHDSTAHRLEAVDNGHQHRLSFIHSVDPPVVELGGGSSVANGKVCCSDALMRRLAQKPWSYAPKPNEWGLGSKPFQH
jgi:hypothetical protein